MPPRYAFRLEDLRVFHLVRANCHACGHRLLRVESLLFREDGEKLEQAFSNYGREKMAVLSRYEAAIERSLYKALHELQRLQAARQGNTVPPPEAVDVDVSTAQLEARTMALPGKYDGFSGVEIKLAAEPAEV